MFREISGEDELRVTKNDGRAYRAGIGGRESRCPRFEKAADPPRDEGAARFSPKFAGESTIVEGENNI